MPHVTLDLSPGGPIIDVKVGVSEPRAAALRAASLPVPPDILIRALIDTGASMCALDSAVIAKFGLLPTGTTPVHTPSTGGIPHHCHLYDLSLALVHPKLSLKLGAVPFIKSVFSGGGFQALLGRNILSNCFFFYNGDAGRFALAF